MPNKDGTGPNGKGSKTGKQMGNCDGAESTGRCGRMRGCGRGFRNRSPQTQE